MQPKRFVEHYREHELICTATPGVDGWSYTLSVVTHRGDDDEVTREEAAEAYKSDVDALRAARERGHELIDRLAEQDRSDGET